MLPTMRRRVYTPGYLNNYLGRETLANCFSDGADYSVPAVNIKENESGYTIEVAAPGLNKEDFNIKLEKKILTVSSGNENKNEENEDNFMRKEFSFKSFSRSFSIPETVDQDKIKATHANGILTLELPKMDEAIIKQSKTIEIS